MMPEHELTITTLPLDDLVPDAANARTHDRRNLDAIRGSLARWGQVEPIVVQKGTRRIVGGHGRVEALRALGKTHAAVVEIDIEATEATALAIALNRTAELASWDDGTLAALLESLPGDLAGVAGFNEVDLESLLGRPDVQEPDVPEAPEDPVTHLGDLWILGEHRLVCGDSTDKAAVELATNGAIVDSVTTDPPYGVDYVGKTKDAIAVPNDGAEDLEPLLSASLGLAFEACRPGATWYVAAPAGPQFAVFAGVLAELGVWRQTLVWVKDTMVLGHSDYHYKHEAIFYGWKPGASHHAPTDRCQTTVWEYARPKASPDHPTTKPVGLYAEMIRNGTRKGDLVYDGFLGSGTSLLAAEQTGRRCVGIELKPGFCDVIVKRWEQLTGGRAERIRP